MAFLFAINIFIFTACQNTEDTNVIPENTVINQVAIDNSSVETDFDDAGNTVDAVMEDSQVSSNLRNFRTETKVTITTDGCEATVDISEERDTLANFKTRTVIIDFGTGCTSQNGQRVRKGKIITVLTVPNKTTVSINGQATEVNSRFNFSTPGAIRVTNFENYYVNDVKVEGTRTITNITTDVTSNPKHTIKVENGKLTFPATDGSDDVVVTWTSDRIREWTSGHQTINFFGAEILIPDANPFNDVFKVYGTYSGVNRRGNAYTATVTEAEAIEIHTECWKQLIGQPSKGKMTVVSENNTAIIDFGAGDCDKTFIVSINGTTYTVTNE